MIASPVPLHPCNTPSRPRRRVCTLLQPGARTCNWGAHAGQPRDASPACMWVCRADVTCAALCLAAHRSASLARTTPAPGSVSLSPAQSSQKQVSNWVHRTCTITSAGDSLDRLCTWDAMPIRCAGSSGHNPTQGARVTYPPGGVMQLAKAVWTSKEVSLLAMGGLRGAGGMRGSDTPKKS